MQLPRPPFFRRKKIQSFPLFLTLSFHRLACVTRLSDNPNCPIEDSTAPREATSTRILLPFLLRFEFHSAEQAYCGTRPFPLIILVPELLLPRVSRLLLLLHLQLLDSLCANCVFSQMRFARLKIICKHRSNGRPLMLEFSDLGLYCNIGFPSFPLLP